MIAILAIDPGPTESAWLVYGGAAPQRFAKEPNEDLLNRLRGTRDQLTLVIEQIASYGMPVGAEVFETVYWSGRFAEAVYPLEVGRLPRKAIVTHLCGSARAKDPNVRQALIDRFGGPSAVGRKAQPGPLYGISGDVWSALAVAVTWSDLHGNDGGAR